MAGSTYTDALEAARQLAAGDQRRLVAELLSSAPRAATVDALAAVEAMRGTMKLADPETLRWLAEDEELSPLAVAQ